KYEHPSDYKKREINFATKYASKQKGRLEKISQKELENDFMKILRNIISEEMQLSGLAILIDEFQEFTRNLELLDNLRQLSEKIPNLIIIGAGLPSFLDNPIFEKMARISKIVNLKSLEKKEVLDLIFNPLQNAAKITRYETEQLFDHKSLFEIIKRANGNPLHVQVLCQNMFEHFRYSSKLNKIELNSEVMNRVMEYYSTISEKSRKINNSLRTCSRDKLNAFNYLYRYEGYTLHAFILSELAFDPINKDNAEKIRRTLFDNFREVKDLQLFEFYGIASNLEEIETLSIDKLSNIEYKFIGDTIDKLYATYFFESLTNNILEHISDNNFEDLLALKLGGILNFKIIEGTIKDDKAIDMTLVDIRSQFEGKMLAQKDIVEDMEYLIKTSSKEKINDDGKKKINLISEKYNLGYPSAYIRMYGYEGYLVLFTDAKIRGKNRLVINFYPVEGDKYLICEKIRQIVNYTDYIKNPLEEYMIQINWAYMYWLPKRPLIQIFAFDISKFTQELYEAARKRNFEKAVEMAKVINFLDVSVREESIIVNVHAINNYAYCLLNNNDLEKAKEALEMISDRYLLGKINLAYIYYLEKNHERALSILKKIFRKKMGENEKVNFINLCLIHPELIVNNKIVEDISLYQITCFNLALIYSQIKESKETAIIFLKKAMARDNAKLIEKRVQNWLNYYYGDIKSALDNAKQLLNNCKQIEYLYKDVQKDIEIFENECNKLAIEYKKD
ncbi:MAG: tetratricopeptide repeat protein, partial [bacterium]